MEWIVPRRPERDPAWREYPDRVGRVPHVGAPICGMGRARPKTDGGCGMCYLVDGIVQKLATRAGLSGNNP